MKRERYASDGNDQLRERVDLGKMGATPEFIVTLLLGWQPAAFWQIAMGVDVRSRANKEVRPESVQYGVELT